MNDEEKLVLLQTMVEETDDMVLSAFLKIAESGVLVKLYPYDQTQTVVPDRYAMTQIKYAAYLINKQGMEFQQVHIENGVHFHFEAADMPESIAREIVPYCGVIM